ncbi:MAG: hypothetical protein JSS02_28795 [Planctomycetes bacterium]|nr:hypothetical protein [Planctomycetota bacterium]
MLNIVRLRYADSPIFIDLPNITSQFEMTGRGLYSRGFDGAGPGFTNLGAGELFVRDAPTLSYHPRSGQEIAKALLTPLSAELFSMVNAGANIEQFMLLAVNEVNDVRNATRAISMIPSAPDDNLEFRRGIQLLSSLEQRGAVELTVRKLEDDDASDPIPISQVKGTDLVTATKENYFFRKTDADEMTVRKQERTLVLRVRDEDRDSPEMRELTQIFRLSPGKTIYKIKSELTGEQTRNSVVQPDDPDGDTIYLNMRSILQMFAFVSKGVCVPPEHVLSGVAPMTSDGMGQMFDWTHVTEGLFCVQSSKKKPRCAEVAVKYRGYWFYIAADDVNSRAILAVLEMLFAVQESEGRLQGPLLTLPLGG